MPGRHSGPRPALPSAPSALAVSSELAVEGMKGSLDDSASVPTSLLLTGAHPSPHSLQPPQ